MSIFKRGKHAETDVTAEFVQSIAEADGNILKMGENLIARDKVGYPNYTLVDGYANVAVPIPEEKAVNLGNTTATQISNALDRELELEGGNDFKQWADDNWVKTKWDEYKGKYVRVTEADLAEATTVPEPEYKPEDDAFPKDFNAQEWVDERLEEVGVVPDDMVLRDENGNAYQHWSEEGTRVISPFEEELDKVLGEIKDLLLEKNASYGDSALNPVRIMSDADAAEQIRIRMDDKLSRLYRGFAFEDTETGNPEDTLKDLVGYYFLLKIAEARNA